MRYLIIEKEQRVDTGKPMTYAISRLTEEITKLGGEFVVAFYKDIEVKVLDNKLSVTALGEDISAFTHILFRGHPLGSPLGYETKRIIVDYIEQYNEANPEKKINIQNAKAIKNIPYYDKLYLQVLFSQNNISAADIFYRANHDEAVKQTIIKYPLITKIISGENDFRLIDGKEKIKKHVYLVENKEDFKQEHLVDQNLEGFLLQELIPTKEDFRVYASKGKAFSGFVRKANEGFMTVLRGEYQVVEIDEKMREIVEKTAKALEADFIAVDLMRRENGEYVVIEISLNPGFKAFETKTETGSQVNIAKIIVESFPD